MDTESFVVSTSNFFTPKKVERITPFYLSDEFVGQYENKKVDWDAIGEFTYLRTYARWIGEGSKRRKEKWYECVRRVVEGTFNIQKKHCHLNKVPWNNVKAQNSAKIMFDLIFKMKFLPPGRGLWTMGTEYVEKNGSTSLNNCFQYNTEIITSEGVKRIGDCSGTTQILLTEGGKWIEAPITNFKKQRLWKLTISRQGVVKEIFTTETHKWLCKDKRTESRNIKWREVITKDLHPGVHKLQYIFGQNVIRSCVTPSFVGIAHGVSFGDGSLQPGERNSNTVKLFGDKRSLSKFFIDFYEKDDIIIAKNLPNYFKKLPDINENSSYLLGWLMGYFSTDGCVSKGKVEMCSYKYENLKFVKDLCYKMGIGAYGIKHSKRISNLNNKAYDVFTLNFMPSSFEDKFFLLEKHVKNFSKDKGIRNWTVINVQPTDVFEDVYCATVDGVGKFALADNILTGNCSGVSTKNILNDPITPFKFIMDLSMLGVGLGIDTIGRNKLIVKKPIYINEIAYIPDSREGWVESLSILLSGFFLETKIPKFDFSLIRPKGAPIKGFGGESSGCQPLIEMLRGIDSLLTSRIGNTLSSTDIVDICDMIGKCVVSGNVRRSALLALGDADDVDFIKMKDFNLYPKECESHRWASNNSIKCIVGQDYNMVAELIAKNGEPGIVWLDNAKRYKRMKDPENDLDYKVDLCNPCGEIFLESMELCNLCETFPVKHESYEEYKATLKYAYLYAKTVTLIPTHWEQTNSVMLRNRRIGTSQSGIIDAFAKHGRKNILDWCDKGYDYLKEIDSIYSDWLCIPKSIKISTVKPSGSVSILAGVSPGIHYPHAEYYIRRVTVSSDSPLVNIMKTAGYNVIKSSTDKTAMLVEFPIHTKYFVKGKKEVTMFEQLLNAADYQRFWSDNAVSITVTFKKEEARDIANALSIFDSKLKGISMLPMKDHGYKHPPYEEITADEYEEMISKIKTPDYSSLTSGEAVGEKYCDSDKCVI